MKAASSALSALINSGDDYVECDLWTVTLSGGQVVRWSGADIPIYANGSTYELGPAIDRGNISEKIGLEVATLDVTITANADDTVNGTPLIQFIARKGFDGANLKLERAFAASWTLPVVGTILRFSGRVTSISPIENESVTLTVSSWAILLNVNIPPNLYQSACLHTVYNSGCALNPASFASSGTVSASPAPTTTGFKAGLTPAIDYFAQGRVVFTSGANSGLSRTVRTNSNTGQFAIIPPLPVAPSAGDGFIAYAGCDKTQGTCNTKFNNLARFKGTPYVPVPETVL